MELTDYRLYERVCDRLHNLTLPTQWPQSIGDILEFTRKTTNKLVPDITVFCNLWSGRKDISARYDRQAFWSIWNEYEGRILSGKFTEWISKLVMPPGETGYYATYNIDSNRIANIWTFNASTLTANFSWGKKNEVLVPIRTFCYMMGGPLTTVQRREVGGKAALVLCTPREAMPHAT